MTLQIKNLSKSYDPPGVLFFTHRKKIHALKDVSAELRKGGSLGIVGESGSGKTTLAKILAGFLRADQGEVFFEGRELLTLDAQDRPRLIQMVFQDPFSSLNPKLLNGTQIYEALQVKSKESLLERAEQLLNDVGLSRDYLKRYPHQLSGGQRQRMAIARALAPEPEILIADEPVSSLDLSVQAQIINLLNDLRQKRSFTQLVISHDLAVIAQLCDSVVVMKQGEIVEQGSTEDVLSRPRVDYTKRLLDATPLISFL